jgi:subtilisin family serine protease
MRRVVLVLALLLPAIVAGAPAHAAPRPMVRAVVVLRAQLDPASVGAAPVGTAGRRARVGVVERALRDRATATQAGLLALLAHRRTQGQVSETVPLWIVNAVAVTATPAVLRELAARPEVRSVDPERTLQAPAFTPSVARAPVAPAVAVPPEPNIARTNAPALWDLGYRGQGTVVAIMDTGVDGSHPDLAGRWRGGTNSWYDPYKQHPSVPTDVNGHGTATMGVLVGGSAGGTAIGMAPDARWIAVKVFNDRGTATSTAIHQGFQWLLDPDGNPATPDAPDVVNDSWTLSAGGCNRDFEPDLTNLRAAGILPVFAAGNYGPTPGTVLSPANNPEAFPVGSVDNADVLDPSSSRGPSACGQPVAPQLVAPGVQVHTTDLYGLYADVSGTSLAAPHAAGALALLLGAFPDLSPDQQAGALQAGAVDLGPAGADSDYGYGRLDALAAYNWLTGTPDFTVSASPSTVDIPAGGSGSATVSENALGGFTGDVALSVSGPPPGVGTATVTPATLTGTGTATVVLTVAAGAPGGRYPLTVTATSGALTHTATVTLNVPVPDFTLTVSPAAANVPRGQSVTFAVAVGSLAGFVGGVTLSASGLPSGASASFSANPVGAPGSATLTLRTGAASPRGTFTVTLTGTSGPLVHRATIAFTVR